MIIENKLEFKTFGPFGSSAGLFLFIAGLILSFYSLWGIILALTGAFAAFTSNCTLIDTENRRIKNADYLFGFFPVGKWVIISPDMKLGLQNYRRGFVGYARANQPLAIKYHDIRIFLYDCKNKKIMPVKKFSSLESAKEDLKNMSALLGLELI
ncbi:MAG: hypothetical protein ACM3RX_01680 [Methanococcaceae archaeon]|jgi:hypothetical protein